MGFINWNYFKEVEEKRKREDEELVCKTKGEIRISQAKDLFLVLATLFFGFSIGTSLSVDLSFKGSAIMSITYILVGLGFMITGIVMGEILKQFKLRRREK
jgi:uncharacterized integral membrane protein